MLMNVRDRDMKYTPTIVYIVVFLFWDANFGIVISTRSSASAQGLEVFIAKDKFLH
jgi:hypothetical protein